MKATVKIYQNDGAGKYGFPVKLIISHQRRTRRKIIAYTGLQDWDLSSQLPKLTHEDFEDLYPTILNIRKKSGSAAFRRIHNLDQAFEFFADNEGQQILNVYDYIDLRIAAMEDQNRIGNAKVYEETKVAFKLISPKLEFSEITPVFLEQFKDYQKAKQNKNTTIRKYIAELRAIYNSAVKAGKVENKQPFLGVFDNLPIRRRRARNYYLDESGIKLLQQDFEYKSYQRAADLSLLQFYFCGCDLVDIYYLKKENLVKNRAFLSRRKLGEKQYDFDVLVPDVALAIINKYRCEDVGNAYVFPWRKSWEAYKVFRDNHCRDLKKVQKKARIITEPKPANLTSKVMRHSFATLGKFARIEEDLLRELMGHERNDVDTIYKDKYPEAERDSAQLKIISV